MKKASDSTQSPDTSKLKKHRLIIAVLSVLAVLLLLAGLARLIGPPLLDAVRNKESFRLWIDAQGPWKYLIMVGIMTAQIIVALVPGAPVEMAAGYAFGLWGGVGLCLIGTAIGNAMITAVLFAFAATNWTQGFFAAYLVIGAILVVALAFAIMDLRMLGDGESTRETAAP